MSSKESINVKVINWENVELPSPLENPEGYRNLEEFVELTLQELHRVRSLHRRAAGVALLGVFGGLIRSRRLSLARFAFRSIQTYEPYVEAGARLTCVGSLSVEDREELQELRKMWSTCKFRHVREFGLESD